MPDEVRLRDIVITEVSGGEAVIVREVGGSLGESYVFEPNGGALSRVDTERPLPGAVVRALHSCEYEIDDVEAPT